MMKCIEITELEQFLQGKLDPERLLAVDEHLCACEQCRRALESVPALAKAGAGLSDMLLGTQDCPEYEELSDFVEGKLTADAARWMRSHINACEPCERDVARIKELRSHASFRDKVTVRPGASRQVVRQRAPIWRRVFAAVPVAVAVAAVAIGFGYFGGTPDSPAPGGNTTIAKNDTPLHNAAPPSAGPSTNSVQDTPTVKPPANLKPNGGNAALDTPKSPANNNINDAPGGKSTQRVEPERVAVLKDGAYKVVDDSGKLQVVGPDNKPARSIPAAVAAAIEEKLTTGTIKMSEAMLKAMSPLAVRGEYVAPPTAPKQIAPIGKILLSATPTLSWSQVDMAEAYQVIVADKDGNRVVEAIVRDTSYTLPEPLERGEIYQWRVGVRFTEGDSWTYSAAPRFKVVSQEGHDTINQIKQQMPGAHLPLAVAYEIYGLHEDAAREYRALRGSNANSPLADKLKIDINEARH